VVAVIGPPLGGFVSQHYGFKISYAVAGLLYTMAAIIRIAMARSASRQEVTPREKPRFGGLKKSLWEMGALVLAGGIITWIFVSDGLRDIAVNMEEQFRPIFMQEVGNLTNTQIGFVSAVAGVAMMAVMSIGGWLSDKRGERFTIMAGYLVVVAGQILFVFSDTFLGFAIAWGISGVAWALISPAFSSLISKAIPQRLRGTAFGLFSTSVGVIALPAPYIGSLLWENFGRQAPFLALPIAILVMLPIMWIKFRLPDAAASDAQPATSDDPPVAGAETAAK
jgi:MFS family permease